jgi:parallel beta-helix repeat protein
MMNIQPETLVGRTSWSAVAWKAVNLVGDGTADREVRPTGGAAARLFVLVALIWMSSPAFAAEITSNGSGGGDWSNPGTWLGKTAPGPDDDAVIQKGDVVDFDRDDSGKITCQKLFIDPRGAFRLKPGFGKSTCCLANGVEARGLIQIDATKSASDTLELRLVGGDSTKRMIKLLKGASLIVRGRAELPEGKHNALLTSPQLADRKAEIEGNVQALKGGVTVDLQRADLVSTVVRADDIDNTGARGNERLVVTECRFAGRGRLWLGTCDTPTIRKNTFTCPGPKYAEGIAAILISQCPLAEVRGNSMQGFHYGVQAVHPDGCTIVGNTAEKCGTGFHLGHGRNNSLYQNTARDCDRGYDFYYSQMASLEDSTAEACKVAVRQLTSTIQIASLDVTKVPKDGIGVLYDADPNHSDGSVMLINCKIAASQVKFTRPPKLMPGAPPPVLAMYCVVVGVKETPPGTAIDVRTVNPMPALAPGAMDPNVRNVPAPIDKGLTPVPRPAGAPRDALPIIVKAWSIDAAGKTVPAPEYEIRVQTPDARVVKSVRVTPQESWFRAKADDPTPTVEVSLK